MQPGRSCARNREEEQKGVSQASQSQDRAKPPIARAPALPGPNDLSLMFSAFPALSLCGSFLATSHFFLRVFQ